MIGEYWDSLNSPVSWSSKWAFHAAEVPVCEDFLQHEL
jgi:hypothetical protein